MDVFIDSLGEFNVFLEQFLWFRGFRFFLGVYMIIMILAVVLMLYRMIRKFSYLKVLLSGQEIERVKSGKFQSRWNQIEELAKSEKQDDWKAAIILSAEMLNEVFEIIEYEGASLKEKLNNLNQDQLQNIEQVKKANDIKNNIVKDERFQIEHQDASEVMNTFKKALQSFEAVD